MKFRVIKTWCGNIWNFESVQKSRPNLPMSIKESFQETLLGFLTCLQSSIFNLAPNFLIVLAFRQARMPADLTLNFDNFGRISL